MPLPYDWYQGLRNDPSQTLREMDADALARNQVQRLPQQNRAQDLALQGAEQNLAAGTQDMTQERKANAQKIAANYFSAIAQSPTPMKAAQAMLSNPNWAAVSQELGLPQFTPEGETDDTIRAKSMDWARAMGADQEAANRNVQSVQVLEDGTIAYVTRNGQLVRTSERARNPMQFVESGGAKGAFDPRTGAVTPITSPSQEIDVAAERAGAESWARAAATAGVDLQKEQVGRQGTLGVWRVAREGLLRGLAGTSTGPVQGLLPAITAGQQIAEGAVAAVAPVLKQLFRSAGEGVFTDRDQQLLLDMVPDRGDHPETVAAKMQMIDAIVEAKLAAPTAIPSPTRSGFALPQQSQSMNFATEADAAAAAQSGQLKPGDRITVGGVSGVWR
jgi:hypothetical protein